MKKLLLFVLLIPVLLFCGCDIGNAPTSIDSRGIRPNFTVLGKDVDMYNLYYVIDNNTDVVYIAFGGRGTYAGGITVALNADGTPVTKEQLYEKNYVREDKQ